MKNNTIIQHGSCADEKSTSRKDKQGFQRCEPFGFDYRECKIPANAKKVKTEQMMQFVKNNGPFAYFFTLTYPRQMGIGEILRYADNLVHRLNNKIFGRGYARGSDWMEGVAILEDHKLGNSRNDLHLHILAKHNARYNKYSYNQILNMFYNTADKVVDDGKRQVFYEKCIDFQEYRDDGAIEYCFKQVWDGNLDRVKFFNKRGMSDKQM